MLKKLLYAIFIVPEGQVHILDMPYQLYTYKLFHKSWVNRFVHIVGILVSTASLYALAMTWPGADVVLLALYLTVHGVMALRIGSVRMLPLILGFHVGMWAIAHTFWAPLLSAAQAHGIPAHPLIVLLICGMLQVIGHMFEPYMPPPLTGRSSWMPFREWLRRLELVAPMVVLVPLFVLVELVSSPRNLLLLLAGAAERVGVGSVRYQRVVEGVDRLTSEPEPLLRYSEFRSRWRLE